MYLQSVDFSCTHLQLYLPYHLHIIFKCSYILRRHPEIKRSRVLYDEGRKGGCKPLKLRLCKSIFLFLFSDFIMLFAHAELIHLYNYYKIPVLLIIIISYLYKYTAHVLVYNFVYIHTIAAAHAQLSTNLPRTGFSRTDLPCA